MLFKGILCILILFAGIGAGWMKARTYENRIVRLQELITVLKVLESEMKYRLDPLPDLLLRVGEMKQGMGCNFLRIAGTNLKSNTSFDLSESWQEALDRVYDESVLTPEDKRIIGDMGIELGKTDIHNQAGLFQRTFSMLETQEKEAYEEKKEKGRVYKSLGAAAGILIVIVLL